jgi:ArsR family metal-binding transcriptional regulator
MLIEKYDTEVSTPLCDPGTERYVARALLAVDISEVLPYLNSILRGALYFPEAKALTWKKEGHSIAFHAREIATSNVEDRSAAEMELAALIDMVNRTWEGRSEITPEYATRRRPAPLAVLKLLPQSNCRKCSEPSCFSFALKLVASQKKLEDCPWLAESQHAEKLAALREIVADAPATG